MSLTSGTFRLDWKTAIVRPLFKLELIKKNYRPISNLFSVQAGVAQYVKNNCSNTDDNCLLTDFQSAYHANYSTENSLARMTNDIHWAMEEQHITMMVDHNILLKILESQFAEYILFGSKQQLNKQHMNHLRQSQIS